MRTNMTSGSSSSAGKLPPIPCHGWCYTEAEEDIVYDYAWTIERFSRAAVNFRTGYLIFTFIRFCKKNSVMNFLKLFRQNHVL